MVSGPVWQLRNPLVPLIKLEFSSCCISRQAAGTYLHAAPRLVTPDAPRSVQRHRNTTVGLHRTRPLQGLHQICRPLMAGPASPRVSYRPVVVCGKNLYTWQSRSAGPSCGRRPHIGGPAGPFQLLVGHITLFLRISRFAHQASLSSQFNNSLLGPATVPTAHVSPFPVSLFWLLPNLGDSA